MRSLLGECGFVEALFEDTGDAHLSRTIANATPAVPGQLGLAVFVDDLAQKAGNARHSLEEGQVRLVRGASGYIEDDAGGTPDAPPLMAAQ